jgi:hypothetical protein
MVGFFIARILIGCGSFAGFFFCAILAVGRRSLALRYAGS